MVQKYKETKLRTIAKGILLRLIVFIVITLVVSWITGSYLESIQIALFDIVVELIIHYIYERVWQRIGWGIVIKDSNDPAKTFAVLPVPEELELE